jgi:hypothetical protein
VTSQAADCLTPLPLAGIFRDNWGCYTAWLHQPPHAQVPLQTNDPKDRTCR